MDPSRTDDRIGSIPAYPPSVTHVERNVPPRSRKERKRQAEMKRRKIRMTIHQKMIDALNAGKTTGEAFVLADKYINREIQLFPQDKELILSAAYQVKEILLQEFSKRLP